LHFKIETLLKKFSFENSGREFGYKYLYPDSLLESIKRRKKEKKLNKNLHVPVPDSDGVSTLLEAISPSAGKRFFRKPIKQLD